MKSLILLLICIVVPTNMQCREKIFDYVLNPYEEVISICYSAFCEDSKPYRKNGKKMCAVRQPCYSYIPVESSIHPLNIISPQIGDSMLVYFSPRLIEDILVVDVQLKEVYCSKNYEYLDSVVFQNEYFFVPDLYINDITKETVLSKVRSQNKEFNTLDDIINHCLLTYINKHNIKRPKIFLDSFFPNTKISKEILNLDPILIRFNDICNIASQNDITTDMIHFSFLIYDESIDIRVFMCTFNPDTFLEDNNRALTIGELLTRYGPMTIFSSDKNSELFIYNYNYNLSSWTHRYYSMDQHEWIIIDTVKRYYY